MKGLRRIVINADDFGMTAGVTRAILEAHAAGVVSSTSLMANGAATDLAIEAARRTPALGVGLHVNVTSGRPLLPAREVPSLCGDDGAFLGLSRFVRRALAGRVASEEVAAECDAQIARMREAGLPITHVDSHHHVHVLPSVWAPVAACARRAGIGIMRLPLEPLRDSARRPRMVVAQTLFRFSHRVASRRIASPRHVDHFRGFSLTGKKALARAIVRVLDTLEPGTTELMVHPGYADRELERWAKLTRERETELAALTSDAVRERLAKADVQLVDFAHVP